LQANTGGEVTWLREKYPLMELPELTMQLNEVFGSDFTAGQLRSFVKNGLS
jgi:hypothetical protein